MIPVKEVMTKNVTSFREDTPLDEIALTLTRIGLEVEAIVVRQAATQVDEDDRLGPRVGPASLPVDSAGDQAVRAAGQGSDGSGAGERPLEGLLGAADGNVMGAAGPRLGGYGAGGR